MSDKNLKPVVIGPYTFTPTGWHSQYRVGEWSLTGEVDEFLIGEVLRLRSYLDRLGALDPDEDFEQFLSIMEEYIATKHTPPKGKGGQHGTDIPPNS